MSEFNFAISGQHYLFDVQSFAHTILAEGGTSYSYALFDRTTEQVIDDVANGTSEVGVLVKTSTTASALEDAFAEAGVAFTEVAVSAPMVALPSSHPLVNAASLTLEQLEDYPYVYFAQGPDAPQAFFEEALSEVPRQKRVACTDRASLTELIMAINGYTVTSGILVGITDGSALTTIPLETDVKLHLGYITSQEKELSVMGERFVSHLQRSLARYVG
ncbi:MAG: LysR family transcriptional regulator substrate-binding protein [Eggerthellaceae bacterium]|nr:LysR family transcriptional regulator substrate-binding protein [Eggerthellaceae bacterium]